MLVACCIQSQIDFVPHNLKVGIILQVTQVLNVTANQRTESGDFDWLGFGVEGFNPLNNLTAIHFLLNLLAGQRMLKAYALAAFVGWRIKGKLTASLQLRQIKLPMGSSTEKGSSALIAV